MKIVDNPGCPLCNNKPETMEHASIECQITHIPVLWQQVEIWLGVVLKDQIKISYSKKIFGTPYKNYIIDTVT